MAAMNIKEKFAEYEYTIKILTAKLQELADENARLTSALSAHDVLRNIYLNEKRKFEYAPESGPSCTGCRKGSIAA